MDKCRSARDRRIETSKLAKLQALPIYGNAYHDQPLFTLAHEILMSEAPTAEKLQAIQRINDAMGISEAASEINLEEYRREFGC